jgi:hypothetical protein
MSLPGLLETRMDTIPGGSAYLQADAIRTEQVRTRIASHPGLRVGLMWAGNSAFSANRHRSIPIEAFSSLLAVEGASVFSLQRGEEWRANAPEGLISLYPDIEDIAGTAAAIMNVDLVITVDTMAAHLAGALGRPAWVMLSKVADWRWFEDRNDTPWYSTLRLFRQSERGDWSPVLAKIQTVLSEQIPLTPIAGGR